MHSNWTAPFFAKTGTRPGDQRAYRLPARELMTQLISIGSARKYIGKIKLYADSVAAKYYERLGVLDLYDEVDTKVLDGIDRRRFSPMHFAVGKLFALANEEKPFVMLDTDFFFTAPVPRKFKGRVFGFQHWEHPSELAYGTKRTLPLVERVLGYGWNWRLKAANTGFAYFGDDAHRRSYAERALRFLDGNDAPQNPKQQLASARITCSEQRFVVFEADRLGVPLVPIHEATWQPVRFKLKSKEGLTRASQLPVLQAAYGYHHTWLLKRVFELMPEMTVPYDRWLHAHLIEAYPREAEVALRLPELRHLREEPLRSKAS